MKRLFSFKKGIGLFMCLHLIACSEGYSILDDVSVETYVNDHGETRLHGFFQFNFADGTRLPTVNVPVYDDLFNEIGMMSFLGHGAISINLNITGTKSIGVGDGLLPNGTPVPLRGVKRHHVVEILLDGGNSIYLASGKGVSMIGAAITIPELDRSTGIDIYFPFEFKGFKGEAGFFSNIREDGQTGLSFFIDISNVIPPDRLTSIMNGVLEEHHNKMAYDEDYNDNLIEIVGQNTHMTNEIWTVANILENTKEISIMEE